MSKNNSIEEAVSDILIQIAELSMKDSLSTLRATVSFIKDNNLNDSIKYSTFYQKYLNWLDAINELSITD